MPVTSYLAMTARDATASVASAVRTLPGCQVIPSDRAEVFIVLTDTPDDLSQKKLHDQLTQLEGLLSLVLVSAFNDPE